MAHIFPIDIDAEAEYFIYYHPYCERSTRNQDQLLTSGECL